MADGGGTAVGSGGAADGGGGAADGCGGTATGVLVGFKLFKCDLSLL